MTHGTDESTAVSAAREARLAAWLITSLVIATQLFSIWSVTYFPSQDGPAHVANAKILLDYHRAGHDLLRQYYTINTNPEPNLAGHVLMAAMMLIVPPLVAEKLLVSLYIVAMPLVT